MCVAPFSLCVCVLGGGGGGGGQWESVLNKLLCEACLLLLLLLLLFLVCVCEVECSFVSPVGGYAIPTAADAHMC